MEWNAPEGEAVADRQNTLLSLTPEEREYFAHSGHAETESFEFPSTTLC
jgi:hypothetical protein